MIDSVARRASSPVINALVSVIAPRYEDVAWSERGAGLARIDIGADLDSDRTEQFVRKQVIRVLAGENVAIADPANRSIRIRSTDWFVIRRLQQISGRGSPQRGSEANQPVETFDWASLDVFSRLIGASCQGVPDECAKKLGLRPQKSDQSIIHQIDGPDQSPWWQIRPHIRLTVAPANRRILAAARRELMEGWPLSGWGYVRRLSLMLRARPSIHELVSHYQQALYAYSSLWRTEDLWRYLISLVGAGLCHNRDDIEINWIAAAISLGRIAPNKSGERIAIRLLEQADRKWADEPFQKARIQYELGNLHARLREPHHLRAAEACLDAAEHQLRHLRRSARVDEMCAQIANTRALAAYHSQQNDRALELELEADAIAKASPNEEVRQWADVTLALNRAQLIERRFGDMDGAFSLISGLVDHPDRGVRAQAACSVARMLLQKENWSELLAVTTRTLADEPMLRENEEMFVRVARALALAMLGRTSEARLECRHIRNENAYVRSDTIEDVSGKLLAACGSP